MGGTFAWWPFFSSFKQLLQLFRKLQDVLSSAAHIATREVPLRVSVTVPNEQNICRCFVNEVWHRDHPISDEGVLQSQQLREKIRQARLLVVCGMGNCCKLSPFVCQNINCWIPTLGTCSLLVKFSGELVASSLKKVFFFGRCDGPECFHVDDEDMRSSGGGGSPKFGSFLEI